MKKQHGFSRSERIRKNIEYRRVFKKGASYRDGIFILSIVRNDLQCHRLGVSISASKVRSASKRNRIKRLTREVFRLNKTNFRNGYYDMVIRLSQPVPQEYGYSAVEERLQNLLKRAKVV